MNDPGLRTTPGSDPDPGMHDPRASATVTPLFGWVWFFFWGGGVQDFNTPGRVCADLLAAQPAGLAAGRRLLQLYGEKSATLVKLAACTAAA